MALAATREPGVLAGLLDCPQSEVEQALATLDREEHGGVDPLAAAARWLQQAPEHAGRAVTRAMAWHLKQDQAHWAARIVLAFGTPAQAAGVLARAGWQLIYRADRALAGELLDRIALVPQADEPGLQLLRLVWQIEVERLPHAAERALQHALLADVPTQALLRSRILQMYDDPAQALACARVAVEAFDDDLLPQALLARYALGFALLETGRPRDAVPPLQRVVHAAVRDGMPALALDALMVLARVHEELGDAAAVQRTVSAARALATEPGLQALPALKGLERLQRRRAQRAQRQLDEPALAPAEASGSYGAFPHQVLDAVDALLAGSNDEAARQLSVLEQRLASAFHCRKWRIEFQTAQLFLAARQNRRRALLAAAGEATRSDDDCTLYDLQHAVITAAAAALAGVLQPASDLARLDSRLVRSELVLQRRRLTLVRALDPAADPALLLDWLRQGAADGDVLDALWLAPQLAGRLDALLAAPLSVQHDPERELAQRLLSRMLAPETAPPAPGSKPPADLTPREWEILQLIGARLSNEQIATRLFVSLATVKTHINRIYGKLGIAARAEAVQRVRELS